MSYSRVCELYKKIKWKEIFKSNANNKQCRYKTNNASPRQSLAKNQRQKPNILSDQKIFIHTQTHIDTHTQTHIYRHTQIYTHAQTDRHTHTHTHTDTQTY